jgi:hypothetical protein
VAIWAITVPLALAGVLFTYAGVARFADAIDHGDEDAQFPSLMVALLGVLTILFAGGLFRGARWGRNGALAVCAVAFAGAIAGLMTEVISTGIAMIVFVVTLGVFFALLGQRAHEWTGGDSA